MLLAHYLLANDAYMSILDSINTPEDLKKVSEDSLIQLCQEIRQKIIDDCAENPGHLGSSLGVVELTVALHYILDTPYDNLVWDVGHQSYAHKILTGRKEQFKTKRKIELPLLTDVGEAIIDYIQHGRPKSESKFIFLRASSPYEPLTSTGLYVIINKYFQRSNVEWGKRRHGAHAMRHSLATNMLKKGTPIAVISDSLGHTDSVTTMKYIHLNVDGLLKCTLDVPIVDNDFYLQKGDGVYE